MSSMRSASSSTKYLTSLRSHGALLGEIEQATGRRDQQVAAAAQRVDLRVDADAAEDDQRAQLDILAVATRAFRHLGGEFAGRRQHKSARRAPGRAPQHLQDGQNEPAVLPVPVWALASTSRPRQHGGNRLGLNGGGRVVALVGDGTQQLGLEPEIGK